MRGTSTSPDVPVTAQGTGRHWLAERLMQAGAQVDFIAAYQRSVPCLSIEQQKWAARAANNGSIWLFSSAEAVTNLQTALPGQSWHQAHALTTHTRTAQVARKAGFGCVQTCRPAVMDVVDVVGKLPLTAPPLPQGGRGAGGEGLGERGWGRGPA